MNKRKYEAIVIGGSAGSFLPLKTILAGLHRPFKQSVFIALHRLRHIRDGLVEAYQPQTNLKITEPDDKELIKCGHIYMAPANYHLHLENKDVISLSVDELVNFSRPSIDLLFESAAEVYRDALLGIVLSGANADGANGMATIQQRGGTTIVQDPNECQMKTMPLVVKRKIKVDHQLSTEEILKFLVNLN